MKQFQLEQGKFPKLSSNAVQKPSQPQHIKKKSNAHSEMIRIIIALLIAIFIYNSSQQTTINYNQIIKNQKMFLVKNIRGVLPTLSGNTRQLQQKWRVVHFQNFLSNYSEIFNNYTFTFNQTKLFIENTYCNFNLSYEWKNYSYNIDFKNLEINQTTSVKKNQQQSQLTNQNDNHAFQNQNVLITDQNNKQNAQNKSQNLSKLQQKSINSQNQNTVVGSSEIQSQKSTQTTALGHQLKQRQQRCQNIKKQFSQVINFTSVWTISDKNLYLLLQNTHLQEDFYLILQPFVI